jgi:FkbM family methyltransferase
MKTLIIKLLHRVLGYQRYLKIFSIWKIHTLFMDSRKSDFLYFNNVLPTDATIAVIGACTGITTIPFAKRFPKRKIMAYEPEASSFEALNAVVKKFRLNNIETFCMAIGNETGSKEFVLPVVQGVRKQGIAHIVDPSITQFNEGILEQVQMGRVDDLTELQAIKLTGIKVVAENFEYEIFTGAKEKIKKDQPLIYCELWDNEKRQPVHDLIRSYGYEIFYRSGNTLLPYHPSSYSGKNFFFKCIHE